MNPKWLCHVLKICTVYLFYSYSVPFLFLWMINEVAIFKNLLILLFYRCFYYCDCVCLICAYKCRYTCHNSMIMEFRDDFLELILPDTRTTDTGCGTQVMGLAQQAFFLWAISSARKLSIFIILFTFKIT